MDLIQKQHEIEAECVLLGRQRYQRELEEGGASASAPGQVQMRRALPALAGAIQQHVEECASKGAGAAAGLTLRYLVHFEPEQAAYLTIRHAFDAADAMNRSAAGQTVTAAAISIGTALEGWHDTPALVEYYATPTQWETCGPRGWPWECPMAGSRWRY